jgi:HSP20 family molecular chaperone IbpA
MTFNQHWAMDPLDIVWKNFMNSNSNYNTIQEKINYPVDIYETENGLCFELAVVGLDKEDLEIQVEGDTLRVTHDGKQDQERIYIARGIARRSFDLAWKVASKFDLSKLNAKMDKGLLLIDIPYSESKAPKKISIK